MADADEQEIFESSIHDLLVEEGFIDEDGEDWEPLITETAEKFLAFYNRKA